MDSSIFWSEQGSSLESKAVSFLPPIVDATTSSSGLNSASTCRHAPHGKTGSGKSVTIAIAASSLSPPATAAATALRSAQIVRPSETFSTLQPVKIVPDFVSNAAPTENFEYGACARLRALVAASINFVYDITGLYQATYWLYLSSVGFAERAPARQLDMRCEPARPRAISS